MLERTGACCIMLHAVTTTFDVEGNRITGACTRVGCELSSPQATDVTVGINQNEPQPQNSPNKI